MSVWTETTKLGRVNGRWDLVSAEQEAAAVGEGSCRVVPSPGCAGWVEMLKHPTVMDQRGYPCEQDPPTVGSEGASTMLASHCLYGSATGYYSPFLDLPSGRRGPTVADAALGFPQAVGFPGHVLPGVN